MHRNLITLHRNLITLRRNLIIVSGILFSATNVISCVDSKAQSSAPPPATTSEGRSPKFMSNPKTMQILKNKLDAGH